MQYFACIFNTKSHTIFDIYTRFYGNRIPFFEQIFTFSWRNPRRLMNSFPNPMTKRMNKISCHIMPLQILSSNTINRLPCSTFAYTAIRPSLRFQHMIVSLTKYRARFSKK